MLKRHANGPAAADAVANFPQLIALYLRQGRTAQAYRELARTLVRFLVWPYLRKIQRICTLQRMLPLLWLLAVMLSGALGARLAYELMLLGLLRTPTAISAPAPPPTLPVATPTSAAPAVVPPPCQVATPLALLPSPSPVSAAVDDLFVRTAILSPPVRPTDRPLLRNSAPATAPARLYLPLLGQSAAPDQLSAVLLPSPTPTSAGANTDRASASPRSLLPSASSGGQPQPTATSLLGAPQQFPDRVPAPTVALPTSEPPPSPSPVPPSPTATALSSSTATALPSSTATALPSSTATALPPSEVPSPQIAAPTVAPTTPPPPLPTLAASPISAPNDTLLPSPTATASPTPAATNTATASPTPALPSPTASPTPCPVERKPLDLILVIDVSASIAESEALDELQAAAKGFLAALDPANDRVGLVTFNTTAELVYPLSTDRTGLTDLIDALDPQGGTNIAAGVNRAFQALQHERRAEALPAIILLTDGDVDNSEAVAAALQAAERVRTAQIRLVTIGLGAEVNTQLLSAMAWEPRHFHHAPAPAQLAAIYQAIAGTLACPAAAPAGALVSGAAGQP